MLYFRICFGVLYHSECAKITAFSLKGLVSLMDSHRSILIISDSLIPPSFHFTGHCHVGEREWTRVHKGARPSVYLVE